MNRSSDFGMAPLELEVFPVRCFDWGSRKISPAGWFERRGAASMILNSL